jgi:hypothetical protein
MEQEKNTEQMNNHKRNDLLLIGLLLIVALLIGMGYGFIQGKETKHPVAVVTVDGKEYGRFPLDKDTQERIEFSDGSYNILVICDGVADMTEASCPDKICVNHRSISKKNESITCLPNKVIITIENGKESDLDFMAQ